MRQHAAIRTLAAVATGAIVLVLAACGSSGKSSSGSGASATASGTPPATATASASGKTATPTSGASVVAPPSTATTHAAAASPRCTASRLSLSFLGGQAATGHGVLGFALRNTSASRCHTYGFPGVLFLARGGGALPTATRRTTEDFFGRAPLVYLVLSPGASASFRVGVTHGTTSTAGCTTAYGLQAIPPDDTHTLRTEIPSGAYECGTATVTPLRPGHSAYP